jgi:arabinofuranosyltransferase
LLLVWGVWSHRWTTDDAFIDFRVAENLWTGHGPVFNISERVEAYTSPLWIGLLTLLGGLAAPFGSGRPPFEWASVCIGLACSGLALGFASLGTRELWRNTGSRSTQLPLGSFAIAALVPFWDFGTSGLEGSLVICWLGSSFWGLTRLLTPTRRRSPLLLAVWLGLGPLIRPDAAIFSVLFVGALVAITTGLRARAACLVAALALPLAYQVFRMGYFASLLPNSALAKEAFFAIWPRGWSYLWDFVAPYQLWLPLSVVAFVASALLARFLGSGAYRQAIVLAAPLIGGLAYGLYIVRVGGDFLHARLLLPAFFALMLPLSTVPSSIFRWAGCVMVPWAVAAALLFRVPYEANAPTEIEAGRRNYIAATGVPNPVTLEDYRGHGWVHEAVQLQQLLAAEQQPDAGARRGFYSPNAGEGHPSLDAAVFDSWIDADIVAYRGAIGLFGYAAGPRIHICDFYGIADPIGARMIELGPSAKPGHDKFLESTWCVARLFLPASAGPWDISRETLDGVRAALKCGDLAKLQEGITGPLNWSRFWRNFLLAKRLTSVRIPHTPWGASAKFCGPKRHDAPNTFPPVKTTEPGGQQDQRSGAG